MAGLQQLNWDSEGVGSKAAALVDLSTVAGNKISNPPWVKFQSAGWVNFPSAPTAQDISNAAFELIRTAVAEAENDLFIVGDAHQRIYRHKVVLSRVGIEVRGRSRSLKVNYRTTDEIRQWACAQLEGCAVDDLDGNADSLRGYHSLTH